MGTKNWPCIILLKNDKMLPLAQNKIKTIALVGPSAKVARTGGGGSSHVKPWESVSPYDGLSKLLGDNVKIEYSEGTRIGNFKAVPIPSQYIKTPDGKSDGFLGEYFNNVKFEGQPVFTRVDTNINFDYKVGSPDPKIANDNFSIRWTAKFTAPQTRKYHFSVSSDDGSRLYIDGKMMIDNWKDHGERAMTCEINMDAAKTYDMKIEFYEGAGDAVIRLGWKDLTDNTLEPSIEQAVEIAKKADVAIVCVGNIDSNESEGSDVDDFKMFGDQDELVQAIAKVNPNTVVVVYGGVPVLMKHWLGNVKAVIAALYPGQEGGTALAEILLGKVNPSGKLPFSYIQEKSESPAFKEYKDPSLKIHYSEGVFVGYRYYDKNNIKPLFPFGHGLSYTTFEYEGLKIAADKTGHMVTVNVKNTGKTAGQEIVQLYVSPKKSSVERPIKELKGFAKVQLDPGQSKTVSIQLDQRAFQFYHPEKKQWTLEPGDFEILVGSSSKDIKVKGMIKL
jgi:beta-glucosidase